MMQAKIFIAGAGGIGQAAALMLTENQNVMQSSVYIGDISDVALTTAKQFVVDGCSR